MKKTAETHQKLAALLEQEGVVAVWRWPRGAGKPEPRELLGAIPKPTAKLGALYVDMFVRVAESQCQLLDERIESRPFTPLRGIVVGGTQLVVLGDAKGLAVSVEAGKRPNLWAIQKLMAEIEAVE